MRRELLISALTAIFAPHGVLAGQLLEIGIFSAGDSPTQRQIIESLRRRFAGARTGIAPSPAPLTSHRTVSIAVGPAGMRMALEGGVTGALICIFTSRQTYARLLTEYRPASPSLVTAIYAEPAPIQQMRLIAAIFKRPVSVGVFLSEQGAYIEPLLRIAAREHALELEVRLVRPDEGMSRAFNRLPSISALLMLPDAGLYNPQNVRELLEASYRRRQPVIGFSAALVAAGSLASAYSDLDDVIAQLGPLVEQGGTTGRAVEPQYPVYWRVAVNESVGRSLDVVIDDGVRKLGDRPA